MSAAKHTPEPWQENGTYILDALGNSIARLTTHRLDFFGNADRIVACINACEGMDDPAAEIARLKAEDHPGPHEKSIILASLRAQRDELAAALRNMLREFVHVSRDGMTPAQDAAYTATRAALAKLEGQS